MTISTAPSSRPKLVWHLSECKQQAATSSRPKVPDVQNPSHYVLGSGSGRLWLSRGGCQQLFQIYPSSGRCLRSHKASTEKVLNQWKSSAVSLTPKELICSLGGARFPSKFATCERWQLMNPSLIHLIEGISIWERWDAFFTLCEPFYTFFTHVFGIQLRLQGQSGNVLVYRWSAMRLRYSWHLQQCSIWLVHIVKNKQHTKKLHEYTNRRS